MQVNKMIVLHLNIKNSQCLNLVFKQLRCHVTVFQDEKTMHLPVFFYIIWLEIVEMTCDCQSVLYEREKNENEIELKVAKLKKLESGRDRFLLTRLAY